MWRGWHIFDPKRTIIALGAFIIVTSLVLHFVVIGALYPIESWPNHEAKAGAKSVAVVPADMTPLPANR